MTVYPWTLSSIFSLKRKKITEQSLFLCPFWSPLVWRHVCMWAFCTSLSESLFYLSCHLGPLPLTEWTHVDWHLQISPVRLESNAGEKRLGCVEWGARASEQGTSESSLILSLLTTNNILLLGPFSHWLIPHLSVLLTLSEQEAVEQWLPTLGRKPYEGCGGNATSTTCKRWAAPGASLPPGCHTLLPAAGCGKTRLGTTAVEEHIPLSINTL